ncbi:MAG: Flp pilus assembly protein CpaB [Acidobacteriota bacterium]
MDRRRILLLFGAAAIMATLLSWFLYAKTIAPQKEQRNTVLAAMHDLAIGQIIRKGDLKKVAVLPRDLPKGAVYAEKDALDRAVLFPISANAPIISGSLSQLTGADGIPATIEPGYRAVSVTITDVSGVAGLIQPGAHVDVLFTRPGTMAEAITSTILQNVKVLAVGRSVQVNQVVDPRAPKIPVATLVVTPEQAQKLELAKNQGKIGLTLRNPLDQSAGVDGRPVNTDILDPAMRAKVATAQRLRNAPDLNDPNAWAELSGEKPKLPASAKEKPAPPRAVVDVFRGDKHVQEVFHD